MKITDKDRSQILRMAGNIACGLIDSVPVDHIPDIATTLAIKTFQAVDEEIGNINSREEQ